RQVVWILCGLTALGSAAGLATHWMPLEMIAAGATLVGALCMFGLFLSTLPPYPLPAGAAPPSAWRRHVPTLRAGVILIVDALLAGVAILAAFLIRFESQLPPLQVRNLLISVPVVMACHALASRFYRTFDVPWEWFGFRDVLAFARTVVSSAALSFALLWTMGVRGYPRGVILLFCVLCLSLGIGLRVAFRLLQDLSSRSERSGLRAAIFGAGAPGELMAALLQKHSALGATPVVFLDCDLSKQGLRIHGVPVRHCAANLREVVREFGLEAVLVPGSADPSQLGDLSRSCLDAGLPLRVLEIGIRDLADCGIPARP
ncbi:MAG: nucleoside-diphosphate sugar epimerase/dehydratase, partial [Bryobacteraceae bacterium]